MPELTDEQQRQVALLKPIIAPAVCIGPACVRPLKAEQGSCDGCQMEAEDVARRCVLALAAAAPPGAP